MDTNKPIEFNGTAGTYLQLLIVTLIFVYVPLFGWAFILNYSASWFAQHSLINGRTVVFRAGYLDAVKFVFINTILLMITLGIYIFWFVPKLYHYLADNLYYTEGSVQDVIQNVQSPIGM